MDYNEEKIKIVCKILKISTVQHNYTAVFEIKVLFSALSGCNNFTIVRPVTFPSMY